MLHRGVPTLKKTINSGICAAACAFALIGCGDGDHLSRSGEAAALGGGVTGDPIADSLTVFAIDADTSQPIARATVRLGGGAAARAVGQTSVDGKLKVSGLSGQPQLVTISAPGYAAATWGMINSSVVTIPLEGLDAVPGNADITVTIPGWQDLPAPAPGNFRLARFAFSRPSGLSALEVPEGPGSPECRTSEQATVGCTVTINVPSDASTVMAVVAEGNDAGTAETSDDVFTMTGIGIVTNLALRPWATHAATVRMLEPSEVARASVTAHGPSSDIFQEVVGVPGVTLDGQLLLYPSLGGPSSTFLIPTASGAFQNVKLWAVATAGNGSDTDWSRAYERGVAAPLNASDDVTLSTNDFIALPSVTRHSTSTYVVSSTGTVNRLEFSTENGEQLKALMFPPFFELAMPVGVLSEPPHAVSIEAFDADVDPNAFAFPDLARGATHIAYADAEF